MRECVVSFPEPQYAARDYRVSVCVLVCVGVVDGSLVPSPRGSGLGTRLGGWRNERGSTHLCLWS